VSEAFFLGFENGGRKYSPEAEPFLVGLLDSQHQHIRLDAALALLRMGKTDMAIKPFSEGIQPGQPVNVRMMAVNYAAGVRDLPAVVEILRQASADPDMKVAARAQQLLDMAPRVSPR